MDSQIFFEAAEILSRLSPQNQAYFMTMIRVAEVAERNVKASIRRPAPVPRLEPPESEATKQCALF